MYNIYGDATISIDNSRFEGELNAVYLMFVYNATTDADKLSFTNCTFENADNTNFYYYYFFGEDHDRVSFTNCVFRGSYNGVELSSGNVSASFTGCSFINNSYSGIYLNPDGQISSHFHS